MTYTLKVCLAVFLCAHGFASSANTIPMASQRFQLSEFVLGQSTLRIKKNAIVACDPDGYLHDIYKNKLIGKDPGKLVRIENKRVLIETYFEKNGDWRARRDWHPLLKGIEFSIACSKNNRNLVEATRSPK